MSVIDNSFQVCPHAGDDVDFAGKLSKLLNFLKSTHAHYRHLQDEEEENENVEEDGNSSINLCSSILLNYGMGINAKCIEMTEKTREEVLLEKSLTIYGGEVDSARKTAFPLHKVVFMSPLLGVEGSMPKRVEELTTLLTSNEGNGVNCPFYSGENFDPLILEHANRRMNIVKALILAGNDINSNVLPKIFCEMCHHLQYLRSGGFYDNTNCLPQNSSSSEFAENCVQILFSLGCGINSTFGASDETLTFLNERNRMALILDLLLTSGSNVNSHAYKP